MTIPAESREMETTKPGPLVAAPAEHELGTVLGIPSGGGTWADRIKRVVDAAPPFTAAQREQLKLLLGQSPRPAPDDPGHYDAITLGMNRGHRKARPAASLRNGA